jgi:xanthine dehydrogenase molybdopterin-binding subunit B
MDGGYTIPNYEGKGKALRTNVPSNTAMRGFGGPEGAIVIEEIIHRIAHILKKDPNEIKKVGLREIAFNNIWKTVSNSKNQF